MTYMRDFTDYTGEFESRFQEVYHYRKFPQMMPWVGSQFGKAHNKILIIGESHYLPKGSTIQREPKKWYESSISDLGINPIANESEIDYTETAEIVSHGMNNWNNGGHRFFRYIHTAMRDSGITLNSGLNDNLFRYFAFYNFFQRPAEESGGSLKNTKLDDKIAYEVFEKNVEILNPDAVFVVSKKAWDSLMQWYWRSSEYKNINRFIIKTNEKNLLSGYAPHTACYRFWYKPYPRYENSFSGKEGFMDFIKENF